MYYKFLYTVDWKKKKKKKNEWMDDSIVEAIAKSQQFSWLPSGRTTLAIMASAAHLKIPEPVNMVNILKATKMLFCGVLVQHP